MAIVRGIMRCKGRSIHYRNHTTQTIWWIFKL